MQALLAISRGIDRVNAFVGKSVMWLILLAVLVSSGNAIVRKMFNWSSNSLLEMQWYLFGAAFMGAAAYTLQQNERRGQRPHDGADLAADHAALRLRPAGGKRGHRRLQHAGADRPAKPCADRG